MVLFAAAALAALPTPAELRALPDPLARREVFKSLGAAPPSGAPPPDATSMGWDIEHYTLEVHIDPAERLVTGVASITAVPAPGGDFVLDVAGPVLTAVRVNGAAIAAEVVDDELRLTGITGNTVSVEVEWTATGGLPAGIQWGRDVVFSFHEPSGARMWLPVYDHPWDKATLDWYITAPDGWVVAANGVWMETAAADAGWSTWHYAFDKPIPTYLMTVHLADYVVGVGGTDIPVYTWAYRGQEAAAAASFGETAEMLTYFSALYAPYPWPSYGNAMAPFGGAMENTTCVSFSDELVGGADAELVNVHELGHHWWGDDVTLATWDDIWLNEGFATYTEALWYERAYGQEGLTEYALWLAGSYYAWRDLEGIGPLYNPAYMWGGTVYDKGGLVLHMLRGVLGDERFFAALTAWEEAYHLSNATTADLEATIEASSGEDLGWFFDEWVYGSGEPTYTWGWAARRESDGVWQLDVTVAQDAEGHRMPVPFRVAYADGVAEDRVVEVAGAETIASFCLTAEPVGVTLDPDYWVLRAGEAEVAGQSGAPLCGDPVEAEAGGCGCDGGGGPVAGMLAFVGMLLAGRRSTRP